VTAETARQALYSVPQAPQPMRRAREASRRRSLTQQEEKTVALVRLVRLFEAGGSATTREVAEWFGVSRRTAQRWLLIVDVHLVPLASSGPSGEGGWRWRRLEVAS